VHIVPMGFAYAFLIKGDDGFDTCRRRVPS
jgi:hypothetical protein